MIPCDMNRFNKLIHSKLYLGGGRLWKVIIYRLVCFYYHCDIPCKREIIDGVYFNHRGFGIVINPNSKIGEGTGIQHSVTIGATAKGCPTIGRNCHIGARAVIIGNVRIGDNVTIGAGTVVVKDIPDNCTVVGAPSRIIMKQ